ncbi:hypothetical protein GQ54DRAFT_298918 [Martensiomyces pterosporus]|nr:hypothetical protein GQ54DRAFT_298918 [Martensiomyces pterosporus]
MSAYSLGCLRMCSVIPTSAKVIAKAGWGSLLPFTKRMLTDYPNMGVDGVWADPVAARPCVTHIGVQLLEHMRAKRSCREASTGAGACTLGIRCRGSHLSVWLGINAMGELEFHCKGALLAHIAAIDLNRRMGNDDIVRVVGGVAFHSFHSRLGWFRSVASWNSITPCSSFGLNWISGVHTGVQALPQE